MAAATRNLTPAQWAAALLQALGIPQTPGAVKALTGWEQAEGGNWHNTAHFNPLNTTQPAAGAGNTGTQGNIKSYLDWQQGLHATAQTLRNGRYGPILAGLRAGNPQAVADAIGQSPWGTGSSLVHQTIGAAPARTASVPNMPAPPAGRGGSTRTVTTPGIDNSALRRQYLSDFLQQGGVRNSNATLAFASGIQGAQDVPGSSTTTTSAAPAAAAPVRARQTGAKAGTPVASLTSEGGLHPTEGLAGYPAHDYFAPAGSAAVAPVSGKVVRLSGHDPAQGPIEGPHGPLGWSVYIQGADGRTYYLTHMGSRSVKVGQAVRQGQRIGTVANYAKYGTPSHIHMGVNG